MGASLTFWLKFFWVSGKVGEYSYSEYWILALGTRTGWVSGWVIMKVRITQLLSDLPSFEDLQNIWYVSDHYALCHHAMRENLRMHEKVKISITLPIDKGTFVLLLEYFHITFAILFKSTAQWCFVSCMRSPGQLPLANPTMVNVNTICPIFWNRSNHRISRFLIRGNQTMAIIDQAPLHHCTGWNLYAW